MSLFRKVLAGALAIVLLASSARLIAQNPAASPSTVDGVFTIEQADRGRRQFRISCESCHNVSEHTKRNFESKWVGSTIGDMFDLIATTMPDGDPGGLKPEEYANIIAFFLSESGYKDGATELPSDLESLKKIRIDAISK